MMDTRDDALKDARERIRIVSVRVTRAFNRFGKAATHARTGLYTAWLRERAEGKTRLEFAEWMDS